MRKRLLWAACMCSRAAAWQAVWAAAAAQGAFTHAQLLLLPARGSLPGFAWGLGISNCLQGCCMYAADGLFAEGQRWVGQ